MSKRQSLFLLILVLCALLILVVSAGAQSSPSEIPNPDPAAFGYAGYAADSSPGSRPFNTVDISTWSVVAYQKLAGDNWDIYLYDTMGSQRLTTHSADDVYPTIDRGGNRVAFSSDRSGFLSLYTMNVDKTDLKKIVDGYTAFSAWSPDGETIAFQYWIDGRYEIFLVNADGSNLRRLTNTPGWDIQPTWSPDGQRIAFASERSGSFAIYIMNVDGTGLKKLTTFPNSLHPTWSPDGAYMGFDADVDGDGWQEVATINIDGSDEKMIFNPGTSATAYAGSWSPDARFLGLIDISLAQQGNGWVWTQSMIKQWGRLSNNIQILVPGDTNWYFDWQTRDVTPPIANIDPINEYSQADSFGFSWSGTDSGGSGLKDYNVYYRSSSTGSWQTYWRDTIATAAAFTGTPGETVDFLVRPRDNAFNQGIWWKQPVVTTTFYNTKISGYILDNTGTLLSKVPIGIFPDPLTVAKTNDNGWFETYTADSGVYTLSANQPNYMPMPDTETISDQNFHRIMTLLPLDTILTNGTFEASGASPTGWLRAGGLPVTVTGQDQATGQYSVRIGSPVANEGTVASAEAFGILSQEVTIPNSMQTPVLAFMTRAVNDFVGDNSGLEVLIQPDGGSEVVLFNSKVAANWTIYSLNVTPWQGQKVDIIFRVTQDSNDPELTVFLDDASLGAANPELWVSLDAFPRAALKDEIVTFDAYYGNRGIVDAGNGKLEITLDPALTFVSADPPATQNGQILSWDWASIAGKTGPEMITVKAQVNSNPGGDLKVIAEISSDTAEAHQANNQAGVFIPNKTEHFLPIMGVTP